MLSADIGTYVALGFAANLVEGALCMARGLIATSGFGAAAGLRSASVIRPKL